MENLKKINMDAIVAGPLFMLSAAILFTAYNMMIKLINPEYNAWHIGFIRYFGGMIVLLTVFKGQKKSIRENNTILLIARGFVGCIGFMTLVAAIRILPVSTALIIFYSFPVFSAIASFIIFRERIGKLEIVLMIIVLMGVGVLLDFELTDNLFGQVFALVGAVFAGITVTLIRSLRKKNGPIIIYLYYCIIGVIVTFPMFAMNPVIPSTTVEWVMILGMVLISIIAQLLMNQGFLYCRGWEGGVFLSSEVIFTAIMGIVFLGDPVSWRFWTSGFMIVGSVIALSRLNADKQKRESLIN